MKKEITEQENDLIEAIRNYRKTYPIYPKNAMEKRQLLEYAQELFDELIFG